MKISNRFRDQSIGWKTGMVIGSLVVLVLIGAWIFRGKLKHYAGVMNAQPSYENSQALSNRSFERLADGLTHGFRHERAMSVTEGETHAFARRLKVNMLMKTRSFHQASPFSHIDYFRKAGIRRYRGPETCLTCHQRIHVPRKDGVIQEVDLMVDVISSVHFTFRSSTAGLFTHGFDGRQINTSEDHPIFPQCPRPVRSDWLGRADKSPTGASEGRNDRA